jgi:hypothetical protein
MKKSLVFASMMLAALAASAAVVTSGPEPNKREMFVFTKIDTAATALSVRKPRTFPRATMFGSKVLDGSAFASMTNSRELYPAGYLKM